MTTSSVTFQARKPTRRVLVLDGRTRQALAITRALGRRGFTVDVGEWLRMSLAMSSKYCHRKVVYPSPTTRADDFVCHLHRVLKQGRYDLVIPNSEETVELLAIHRTTLSEFAVIPVPGIDIVENIIDKGALIKQATSAGIPCPETHMFESVSAVEASSTSLEYPVVIKPRRSGGALGLRIVYEPNELKRQYELVSSTFPNPLVQEFIPDGGGKFSYCGIVGPDGSDKASFVHEYLRLYPPEAGVGTLARSATNDTVRNLGSRLLTALGWLGVAEVEFKIDPRDGTPKLLEINPRFWGMTEVAIRAGMDLPFHLHSLLVMGDRQFFGDYENDVYVRWLLPGDILHLIANWRNIEHKLRFLTTNPPNTHFYVLNKDDPGPSLTMPLTALYSLLNKQTRELVFRHC